MRAWAEGVVQPLAIAELGESYRRYRLSDPAAEEVMVRSLRQYGQLTPVVVCLREGRPELVDGFKRRAAAAFLPWRTLSARLIEADEAQAKAAIYGLNRTGHRPQQLEEAWIVHALVREDGLTQVQASLGAGRKLLHRVEWAAIERPEPGTEAPPVAVVGDLDDVQAAEPRQPGEQRRRLLLQPGSELVYRNREVQLIDDRKHGVPPGSSLDAGAGPARRTHARPTEPSLGPHRRTVKC